MADIIFTSLLIGTVIGVVYDVFRIVRIAFNASSAVIFVEDICFFLIAAVMTFGSILSVNHGQVRVYIILCEIFGFAVYYFTVGKMVIYLAEKIIAVIKAILKFLFRIIVRPVLLLMIMLSKFIYKVKMRSKAGLKRYAFKAKQRRLIIESTMKTRK